MVKVISHVNKFVVNLNVGLVCHGNIQVTSELIAKVIQPLL